MMSQIEFNKLVLGSLDFYLGLKNIQVEDTPVPFAEFSQLNFSYSLHELYLGCQSVTGIPAEDCFTHLRESLVKLVPAKDRDTVNWWISYPEDPYKDPHGIVGWAYGLSSNGKVYVNK